jgi:hypothetical protein
VPDRGDSSDREDFKKAAYRTGGGGGEIDRLVAAAQPTARRDRRDHRIDRRPDREASAILVLPPFDFAAALLPTA